MTDAVNFEVGATSAADHRRRCLRQDLCDPDSLTALSRLNVAAGWACLEIGAGYGSIARWLAERVGPNGHVVATDRNPHCVDVIARGAPAQLEARLHDIERETLEGERFDLVYTRFTLAHFHDPMAVLHRLADAVVPAGWLVIEDTCFDERIEGTAAVRDVMSYLARAGRVTGSNLSWLCNTTHISAAVPLTCADVIQRTRCFAGNSTEAEFWILNIDDATTRLNDVGADRTVIARAIADLRTAACHFVGPAIITMIFRRESPLDLRPFCT